jgi:hypothetical protein
MRLPDDRILVLGGANYYNTGAYLTPDDNSEVATTPEIGTGTSAWSLLSGATSTTAFGALHNHWWYPRAFNAPDGSVFGVSGDQMWDLSTSGNGSISMLGTLPNSIGVSGAAVMYAPGQLLLAGGGQDYNQDSITATNAATTVNINGTTPVVTSVAPMKFNRNWLNLTVLPTGEVLANGGTQVGTQSGASNSDYTAEIWNPNTQTWRTAATAARIRTYHSTALLMPSGAVFTGGGGDPGPEDNFNAEMYYPPYLFSKNATTGKVTWANRPTIRSVSGSLAWGGSITVGMGDTRTISSVSLISAAAVTHSVNQDQRRIPLTFTQNGGSLTIAIPSSRNVVPPGNYLLTAVASNGVPSPAQMLTIRNGGAGSVTVYEPNQSTNESYGTGTDVSGTVPLTIGSSIGLQPVNYPGYLVRDQNFQADLDPTTSASSALDQADSSFVVREGLASPTGVSFEAINYPGYFLEDQSGQINLVKNDGSSGFAGYATFVPQTGLTGQNTSFAVYADQTVYLRHQNFVLYAQSWDGSDQFRKDATFSVRPALSVNAPSPGLLTVGNTIGLQPGNFPTYLVRHSNFVARIDPINQKSGSLAAADSSFTLVAGLAMQSGLSFESVNYPGYFLVVNNGAVDLQANDGSLGFAANATFLPQPGLTGTATAFVSFADPTLYLRHQNYLLMSQPNDGSSLFAADASFNVVAGLSQPATVVSAERRLPRFGWTARGTPRKAPRAQKSTHTPTHTHRDG